MAIIDSGLGWQIDEQYFVDTSGTLIDVTSGRQFKFNKNGPAIVVHVYDGANSGPVVLSTVPANIGYDQGNTSYNTTGSYTVNGYTWYQSTYNYWFGGRINSTGGKTYNQTVGIITVPRGSTAEIRTSQIQTIISALPITYAGSYTIAFDANGGTGMMANQTMIIDTPTSLTLNTFTREHFIFRGWATSPWGEVVYTDGETVENLAGADETVTLYAVWQPVPLSVKIQYNASEKNRLDKDVTTIKTLWGTLRDNCSIVDPVIIIECNLLDIVNANYATIDLFGRSYFINNITSVRQGLNEISCHVDVISSFKAAIRTNEAILSKSENDWNLYLNDGSLKTYQDAEVVTQAFPSGFTSQSFVLAIAGS